MYYPDFYAFEGNKVILWDWKDGDFNKCSGDFQQFTGLLDKNNKEMYEGDIIKTFSEKYKGIPVIHAIEVKIPDIYRTGIDSVYVSYEIIGNIFENPSLLETKTSEGNLELLKNAQDGKKATVTS